MTKGDCLGLRFISNINFTESFYAVAQLALNFIRDGISNNGDSRLM